MEYNGDNFAKNVIEQSYNIPVLVDFWADWCGPCKVLGPVLERVAGRHTDEFRLVKVDTERHQQEAMQYGIRSIPNVKLFIDGKVADEFVGALPEDAIESWLKKALPGKNAKQVEAALELLGAGEKEKAKRMLEDICAKEPSNERAHVSLSQIILFDEPEKAIKLVEGIDAVSEFNMLAESTREIAAMLNDLHKMELLPDGNAKEDYIAALKSVQKQDFEKALDKFINVIQKDRYYRDDAARKACIALFKYIGERDPLTKKYRGLFSRALYV